jgi:hypothetical protein
LLAGGQRHQGEGEAEDPWILHKALVGFETLRCDENEAALRLVGRVRDDAECVYAVAHQRGDRRVDHPMPLELRPTGECGGHQRHPVMPTLPRARMTGVQSAVIEHLDREGRERLLEGGANLAGGGGMRRRFLAG